MDIDKLFKVPKLPMKRKMPDQPTPDMLKKFKQDDSAPPTSVNKGKSRAVTIEEVPDADMDTSDSGFAPGGDADYFVEEDDEGGRFFGGGLTSEQKDILNIFDHAGGEGIQDEDVDALSLPSIRKLLTKFERAANKNQDHRSKFPDDPTKFIESEADLDTAIKSLLPLAQVPTLAYPELIKSGALAILIGLLSHENADIVIDVVEVIHELTDEDVGGEMDEEEEDEEISAEEALKGLIEKLLENSILELLVDNLKRLNESEESDRQGVFHILGVFENMLGFDPKLSRTLTTKTTLYSWLLERVQAKKHDENRGYAAELMSILLQNSPENRLDFSKHDGIEIYLTVLSHFRRRDPVDGDETEFMENIFDGLCSALGEAANKSLFIKAEGTDLMVIFMQERPAVAPLAIKALDYAMSNARDIPICEAFVECLGLKSLFAALMGKVGKKKAKLTTEDLSHVLGIMSSLFTHLNSDTPGRIRLLAKFVEGNYEKVEKLLEIRKEAATRLKMTDKKIAEERKAMEEAEEEITEDEELQWYLRRLDSGLFTLQHTDYILAWIIMEDDGIRDHAQKMLSRNNLSLQDIISTLQIYHDNVDENEGSSMQKDILNNLIAVLMESS